MPTLVEIGPSNASQGQYRRKDATEQIKNPKMSKKIMKNPRNLIFSDNYISMNHDMKKTDREWSKNLVDKAKDMNKQENLGGLF